MKKALKIVVLAKQVPDTRNVGKDAMTPEGTVNRAALPAIFNPEDLNALEMALALKDRTEGSTVHILTMGPQRAADIIRDAMFRGADGGYLLSGRDFAPRVSSALYSGLTADCTQLVIGDHKDAKTGKEYKDLLYQIRPAFGGNIIATIVNPDNRPQMATVREGVMRREYAATPGAGEVKKIDWQKFVKDTDLAVRILDREISESKIDIKGASVIVAGGYGMGSKENFELVFELADVLGAEVGASRAAVDAGFADHARQVGQTGVTVRPKLYIACGISGQIQHTAGMDGSAMIISINTDPEAPINKIADYAITGDVNEIIPKMIKYYKQNSK